MDEATQRPLLEDARQRDELVESIILALTLCGAALNRDSIKFARAIADVTIWSAKHAIRTAVDSGDHDEGPEWECHSCGEPVPDHFGICWNCETERPVDAPAATPVAELETIPVG
jgi:hypothetical protein